MSWGQIGLGFVIGFAAVYLMHRVSSKAAGQNNVQKGGKGWLIAIGIIVIAVILWDK